MDWQALFDVAFVLKTPSALPIVPSVIVEKRSQNFPVVFGQIPNINGKIGNVVTSHSSTTNPFSPTGSFWTPTLTDGELIKSKDDSTEKLGEYDGIGLKASLSSEIYNNSKLQVPALQCLACIRI